MSEQVIKEESTARSAREDRVGLEYIAQALHGLQFGEVTVIVQDGIIIQVERTEKRRLQRTGRRQ
jgi:hypothetical protein